MRLISHRLKLRYAKGRNHDIDRRDEENQHCYPVVESIRLANVIAVLHVVATIDGQANSSDNLQQNAETHEKQAHTEDGILTVKVLDNVLNLIDIRDEQGKVHHHGAVGLSILICVDVGQDAGYGKVSFGSIVWVVLACERLH